MNNLVQKSLIHRVTVQFDRQDNIFIYVQNRDKVVILKNEADVAAPKNSELFVILLCQFLVAHDHGSAGGCIQSSHHVKQSGLAAAGGSNHRNKFSIVYRKIHAIKSTGNVWLCAVILFQVNCL